MSVTLIRGGDVICRAKAGGGVEAVEDGAVLVRDGKIAEIGRYADLKTTAGIDREIGGPQSIVFPGFVNAHHHVGLTPLQLGSPDLPLELWINRRIGGKSVPLYLDTLYSAFELVRSGVTTVQHLHGRVLGPISNIEAAANDVIRAYQELGMRVSYTFGIRDQNRIVYEPDEDFVKRLPDDLGAEVKTIVDAQAIPTEHNFDLFESLAASYKSANEVSIQLSPVNLQWCSDQALTRASEVSKKHGASLHMHLLETPYQRVYVNKRTGGSVIEFLDKFDLLGPALTLGHGVWLNDDDLDLIAESGTNICHNCSSNMRLRSGTAPIHSMRERDICIGIGIDEAGLNDDRDMLQEMRLVLHRHAVPGLESDNLSAADVFQMATEHGARTTGFADRIGVLEPGRDADVVIANRDTLAFPYLDADVPAVDALVRRGKPSCIETVMVGGELVLHEGRFVHIDEDAVLQEIADILGRPATPEQVRERDMAKRLQPHIRAFYDGFLPPNAVSG